MSESKDIKKERSSECEKPASNSAVADSVFPPFPAPDDLLDFDDDISTEEKNYYREKFPDIRTVVTQRLHCSACDRHLGSSHCNGNRIKVHPMLRTLTCHTCHTFYNSGEFDKGDDGSELYCRWCGQGGQVYCCSDCPHVFCAKCIKRNFGMSKIKEIENTDDWKCFKCNSKCLWDLRAICWALIRVCDLKNKLTEVTVDPRLKEEYEKERAIDFTQCCKNKKKYVKKKDEMKKEPENVTKINIPANIMAKLPSTIQVKKFASVFAEDAKNEKKAKKRPVELPNIIRNPIPIAPVSKLFNSSTPAPAPAQQTVNKRMRFSSPINNITPIRILERSVVRPYPSAQRFPARSSFMPMPMLTFNGLANNYNNIMNNDNINLSLDSLTQGLDMAAVNTMSESTNDDLVCTPDLPPLEPLCEVTEDNNTDDDVQCITPAPAALSKPTRFQPCNSRIDQSLDNIIQMTENDVTVNKVTGGLKFRVDPQTLSSNKMYRLPDGRVFAITANPNMPAGYSATIVAVTEAKNGPKGSPSTSNTSKNASKLRKRLSTKGNKTNKSSMPVKKAQNVVNRTCDLDVPIEWFRYNLVDAVDALDYSQKRLSKLKKESNTMFLRTRTAEEMKKLHKRFENVLNTSINRFIEIKRHVNDEFKSYLSRKAGNFTSEDEEDDDDDVEILPNNDDPIFIDENSVDSINQDTTDVDLTANTSDRNVTHSKDHVEDNGEKVDDAINDSTLNDSTTLINSSKSSNNSDKNPNDDETEKEPEETPIENNCNNSENEKSENESDQSKNDEKDLPDKPEDKTMDSNETEINQEETSNKTEDVLENNENENTKDIEKEPSANDKDELDKSMEVDEDDNTELLNEKDPEKEAVMSDELIADLLKDDTSDATVAPFNNSVDFGDLE